VAVGIVLASSLGRKIDLNSLCKAHAKRRQPKDRRGVALVSGLGAKSLRGGTLGTAQVHESNIHFPYQQGNAELILAPKLASH
jgi:hypothetical protein